MIVFFSFTLPLMVFSLLYSLWIWDITPYKLLIRDLFEGKFVDYWEKDVE